MPSEGVFLVRDGQLIEMGYAPFLAEELLQSLLEQYPALLSGRQIDPASPREWLLIAREKGVPGTAGGADLWSADHLFVDQDGIPTIVEVKRSTDTRIRREVVGQMFDYAANGVRYWPVERLREDLAARTGGAEAADRAVADLLIRAGVPELSTEAYWQQVESNLRAGRLRMLFVADVIPESLRRIIEFLNEQMTQCEVLGIEIRQYVADGHQVLAPTVIGQTSESRRLKGRGDTRTFDELLAASSDAVRTIESRLTALADERGWLVTTTRVGRHYRLPNNSTLVQLFPADFGGGLQFVLEGVSDAGLTEQAAALQAELGQLAGKPVKDRRPWVKIEPILEKWDQFAEHWLPAYAAAVAEASERPRG